MSRNTGQRSQSVLGGIVLLAEVPGDQDSEPSIIQLGQ